MRFNLLLILGGPVDRTARQIALALAVGFALVGCASLKVHDMAKVQAELQQGLQANDNSIQKAQGDFAEKTALLDTLKHAGDPSFAPLEGQLRRHLRAMQDSLAQMISARKPMLSANSDMASLAYAHKEIRGDTPEYARVEEARANFQSGVLAVRSALLDFSRESQSLSDEVTSHKLYFVFDVNEFQTRLQKALKEAQLNLESMKADLHRAEVNSNQGEGRAAIFEEMNQMAQDYLTRAGQFAEIANQVQATALGNAKVSTLDSQWPQLKKLVERYDRLETELKQKLAAFHSRSERLKGT